MGSRDREKDNERASGLITGLKTATLVSNMSTVLQRPLGMVLRVLNV